MTFPLQVKMILNTFLEAMGIYTHLSVLIFPASNQIDEELKISYHRKK